MTSIKQLVNSISIIKLNSLISILFFANQLIKSPLLWIIFFVGWELLLIKLFIKQREENKYMFSYVFIAALMGVLYLKIWSVMNWIS